MIVNDMCSTYPSLSGVSTLYLEPCAGHAAAADNLWEPPPPIFDGAPLPPIICQRAADATLAY